MDLSRFALMAISAILTAMPARAEPLFRAELSRYCEARAAGRPCPGQTSASPAANAAAQAAMSAMCAAHARANGCAALAASRRDASNLLSCDPARLCEGQSYSQGGEAEWTCALEGVRGALTLRGMASALIGAGATIGLGGGGGMAAGIPLMVYDAARSAQECAGDVSYKRAAIQVHNMSLYPDERPLAVDDQPGDGRGRDGALLRQECADLHRFLSTRSDTFTQRRLEAMRWELNPTQRQTTMNQTVLAAMRSNACYKDDATLSGVCHAVSGLIAGAVVGGIANAGLRTATTRTLTLTTYAEPLPSDPTLRAPPRIVAERETAPPPRAPSGRWRQGPPDQAPQASTAGAPLAAGPMSNVPTGVPTGVPTAPTTAAAPTTSNAYPVTQAAAGDVARFGAGARQVTIRARTPGSQAAARFTSVPQDGGATVLYNVAGATPATVAEAIAPMLESSLPAAFSGARARALIESAVRQSERLRAPLAIRIDRDGARFMIDLPPDGATGLVVRGAQPGATGAAATGRRYEIRVGYGQAGIEVIDATVPGTMAGRSFVAGDASSRVGALTVKRDARGAIVQAPQGDRIGNYVGAQAPAAQAEQLQIASDLARALDPAASSIRLQATDGERALTGAERAIGPLMRRSSAGATAPAPAAAPALPPPPAPLTGPLASLGGNAVAQTAPADAARFGPGARAVTVRGSAPGSPSTRFTFVERNEGRSSTLYDVAATNPAAAAEQIAPLLAPGLPPSLAANARALTEEALAQARRLGGRLSIRVDSVGGGRGVRFTIDAPPPGSPAAIARSQASPARTDVALHPFYEIRLRAVEDDIVIFGGTAEVRRVGAELVSGNNPSHGVSLILRRGAGGRSPTLETGGYPSSEFLAAQAPAQQRQALDVALDIAARMGAARPEFRAADGVFSRAGDQWTREGAARALPPTH